MTKEKSTQKSGLPLGVRGPKTWDLPYQWIPAALDSYPRGLSVGVRYKASGTSKSTTFDVRRKKTLIVVDLPDRVLYVNRAYHPSHNKLFPSDVDQLINLDMNTNFDVLADSGLYFGMINSSALPKKYRAVDFDAERTKLNILADSGGFQLNSGAKEFLDPVEIIDTHNTTCDIGIALDVPLPQYLHKHFLARAAKMQRNSLRLFLDRKRPSLELMNVFHGTTIDLRRKFRDVVEVDGIDRVAIGGGLTMDLHPLVLHILSVIQHGRVYDQYHILGVSGIEKMILLAYLANRTRAPLITSDSSSYIQVGINNGYWLPNRPTTVLKVGRDGGVAHTHTQLPCSCSLCSMVKFLKVLTLDGVGSMHFISVWHNLHVMKSTSEVCNDVVKGSHSDILDYAKYATNNNAAAVRNVQTALRVADYALEHSVDAAAKKWPGLTTHQDAQPTGLFDNVRLANDVKYSRFDKVLTAYEDYFGRQ